MKYKYLLEAFKNAKYYEDEIAREYGYDISEISYLSDNIMDEIFSNIEEDLEDKNIKILRRNYHSTKDLDMTACDFDIECKMHGIVTLETIKGIINNEEIGVEITNVDEDENSTYFTAYVGTQI